MNHQRTIADLPKLAAGEKWELVNSNAADLNRGWGQLLSCENSSRLIMLGGFNSRGESLSDAYTSDDGGQTWVLACAACPWLGRAVFAAAVSECGQFLYVLGGVCPSKGVYCRDVWLSRDLGVSWSLVADSCPWEARSGFGVALNPLDPNDLTIFGGSAGNFACLNDTWRSTDGGQTWRQLSHGPWCPRVDFSTTQQGQRILLAGGDNWEGQFFNDLWISDDRGGTWTAFNLDCAWSPRAGLAMVGLGQRDLVVIGGNVTGLKPGKTGDASGSPVERVGDVWRSFDGGVSWTLQTANAAFDRRTMARAVSGPDGSIILLGGWLDPEHHSVASHRFFGDVWVSRPNAALVREERLWLSALSSTRPLRMLGDDVWAMHILPFLYGTTSASECL